MKNNDTDNQLINQISKKKKNILLWLDFDAYSYVNFGIAKSLSKNNEFSFIGIVTTGKPQEIYSNDLSGKDLYIISSWL